MGMNFTFYISAVVAVAATLMVITRRNAVHALLYLIVSLLSVAVIFYVLGAPFIAALEVIIYAGAIMVLFVFVIMMVQAGPRAAREETAVLTPRIWIGPTALAAVLLAELVWTAVRGFPGSVKVQMVSPTEVGKALFGPYLLGVELASLLLLAGLIGAWHLGRRFSGPGRSKGGPSW